MAWQTADLRAVARPDRVAAVARRRRSAARAVYESAGCASCHVVNGRGGVLGPELTSIGALRGAPYLRDAIVKPAAAHPPGYLVVRAVLNSGAEIRGIRVNEDVFWIHIRDAQRHGAHAAEIASSSRVDRELEGTLMPSYASRLAAGGGRRSGRVSGDAAGCEMTNRIMLRSAYRSLRQPRSWRLRRRAAAFSASCSRAGRSVADVLRHRTARTGSRRCTQINADNVARLKPVWVYQPPGTGSVECTPIVADGVMYVTSGPTSVIALDLKSGKPIWEWTRPIAASVLNLGFPRVNRGVAILDDTVYVGTLDGYLVALDAKAGIERWAVHVGENPTGHAITAAPLIVGDKVIVGISGGEAGIRGFLDAYDAKTGKQVWRFWTVPSPGEPGSEYVAGRQLGARRRRDMADRLVRSGAEAAATGAPAIPDPTGTATRARATTSTPRRSWRSTSRPARRAGTSSSRRTTSTTGTRTRSRCSSTREIGGQPRSARRHGEPQRLLLRARSQDRRVPGRHPVREADLGEGPRRARPADRDSRHGAVGERHAGLPEPAGLDQLVEPVLQPRRPACSTCRCARWDRSTSRPASSTSRGPTTPAAARSGSTKNRGAPSARSTSRPGKQAWDFRLPSPPWAGVMSTAGGLVFGGSNEGNFFALDAKSGKPLWQFQTGGQIRSGPMSFLAGDKQHVAVAGGHAIFVFALD